MDTEYDDKVIAPLKTEIAAQLTAAPFDTYVDMLGGFRALKESGVREEVRLQGPGFHFRNDLACGIVWAAERLAIAYLDAKAQGALS